MAPDFVFVPQAHQVPLPRRSREHILRSDTRLCDWCGRFPDPTLIADAKYLLCRQIPETIDLQCYLVGWENSYAGSWGEPRGTALKASIPKALLIFNSANWTSYNIVRFGIFLYLRRGSSPVHGYCSHLNHGFRRRCSRHSSHCLNRCRRHTLWSAYPCVAGVLKLNSFVQVSRF